MKAAPEQSALSHSLRFDDGDYTFATFTALPVLSDLAMASRTAMGARMRFASNGCSFVANIFRKVWSPLSKESVVVLVAPIHSALLAEGAPVEDGGVPS